MKLGQKIPGENDSLWEGFLLNYNHVFIFYGGYLNNKGTNFLRTFTYKNVGNI